MFSRFHNRKGFTLIELMIVVVIIGILAALAIPRFMQATVKTKQSECKGILKQIYTMERALRQESGTYVAVAATTAGNTMAALGIEVPVDARYTYWVDPGASGDISDSFYAKAQIPDPGLDDDDTVDEWWIDDNGTLECVVNDVTNVARAFGS